MKLLLLKNPLIFDPDEELLDPICAFSCLIVYPAAVKRFKPKCLLSFRDSLLSVNTESQIAIILLYTLLFFLMMYASNDAQISGLILNVHGVSLYFRCLGCRFIISLGPYWMEDCILGDINTHFYVGEIPRFFKGCFLCASAGC